MPCPSGWRMLFVHFFTTKICLHMASLSYTTRLVCLFASCLLAFQISFANPTDPKTNLTDPKNSPSNPGNFPNANAPLFDTDFETPEGFNAWVINPFGKDNAATNGRFQIGLPEKSRFQPGATAGGKNALITGLAFGGNAGAFDVDEGMTSAASPEILLPELTGSERLEIGWFWFFSHAANAEPADFFRVKILADGKESTLFELIGGASECTPRWAEFSTLLNEFAGKTIRILVETADSGEPSTIESGLDELKIRLRRPQIQTQTSASAAFDDNGNAPGGKAIHTLDVFVAWNDFVAGDSLVVRVRGAEPEVRWLARVKSADTARFSFKVAAGLDFSDVKTAFFHQKTIAVNDLVELPKMGGLLSPCLAGELGGKIWLDQQPDGLPTADEPVPSESTPIRLNWLDKTSGQRGELLAVTDYLGQFHFKFGSMAGDIPTADGLEIRLLCESASLSARAVNGQTDLRFLAAKPGCEHHFGLVRPAKTEKRAGSIGNRIWEDLDGNGIQDAGEPGLDGVIVSLYDELGNLVQVATTDKTGGYFFDEKNVQETLADAERTRFAGPIPGKKYFVVVGKAENGTTAFSALAGELTHGSRKLKLTKQAPGSPAQNSDGQLFSGFLSVASLLNGFPGCAVVGPAAGGEFRIDFGFSPETAR